MKPEGNKMVLQLYVCMYLLSKDLEEGEGVHGGSAVVSIEGGSFSTGEPQQHLCQGLHPTELAWVSHHTHYFLQLPKPATAETVA